jgi:hypothetical protein
MKGGKKIMKLKSYKNWTAISAVVWAVFTFLAVYAKQDLGTVATLGGIALMFTWMYEEKNIRG